MFAPLLALGLVALTPEIRHDLRTRTPILTYHDMLPARGPGALWFDCSVPEFEAQLDWLSSRGARFITVNQMYNHLTNGSSLRQKAVAITFADNYLGFYRYALPVLRRRRIPATMFVHTDFVGSRIGRPKMTWEQLRELDREGLVTIASQTKSHPEDLRRLSDQALKEEMLGSKRALESRLGHPVPYLAYPNGKFDSRVARAAGAAGYLMAFTEELMPAERSPSIFKVARYVHTKYRRAWADSYGKR